MSFQLSADVIVEGELPDRVIKDWCPWATRISVPRINMEFRIVKQYEGNVNSTYDRTQATHNFRQQASRLAEQEMDMIGFKGEVRTVKNFKAY